MKILEVKSLKLPEIKVVRFGRFPDERGFFSETFRKSEILKNPELGFLKDRDFTQVNESFAKKGVIKGLHFQWSPYMGKLVRTIYGHMTDIILDIRLGSPNFGKIIMYDMPADRSLDYSEWIWLPPGFAHGNYFSEDTLIEYFCTGEYSPPSEAGVSPLSEDLDWSLCDAGLKQNFKELKKSSYLISEKDRAAANLSAWVKDPRVQNFKYENLNYNG